MKKSVTIYLKLSLFFNLLKIPPLQKANFLTHSIFHCFIIFLCNNLVCISFCFERMKKKGAI